MEVATKAEHTAYEIVLAVFHIMRPNGSVLWNNWARQRFNDIAELHPNYFKSVKFHQCADYSKDLEDAVETLTKMGHLERTEPGPYFGPTKVVRGAYGEAVLNKFTAEEQKILYTLAEDLAKGEPPNL